MSAHRHTCQSEESLLDRAYCLACQEENTDIIKILNLVKNLNKRTNATPKDLLYSPIYISWKKKVGSDEALKPFRYDYRKVWGLYKRIGPYLYIKGLMNQLDERLAETSERRDEFDDECRFIMSMEEFHNLKNVCEPLDLFQVHTRACALMRLLLAEDEIKKAKAYFESSVTNRHGYLRLALRRGSDFMTSSMPLPPIKRRSSVNTIVKSKSDLYHTIHKN